MATNHRPAIDRAISDMLATRELQPDARNHVPRVTYSRRTRAATVAQPAPAPRLDVAAVRAAARERVAAREDALYQRLYTAAV